MLRGFNPVMQIFRESIVQFQRDRVPRLSAALAYYTIFSLAPILIITIELVSLFIDQSQAQAEVVEQVWNVMGQDAAEFVAELLNRPPTDHTNWVSAVFTLGAFLYGASNVFSELQDSLNAIWGVEKEEQGNGILTIVRKRGFTFLVLLLIGGLLLLAVLADAVLSIFNGWIQSELPDSYGQIAYGQRLVFFGLLLLLFGLLYKTLPDISIRWHDVWVGALVAAILFSLGRWAIGLFVSTSATLDAFGAAGTVLAILIWIYFSAQFFFFGAEFAQAYANQQGRSIDSD